MGGDSAPSPSTQPADIGDVLRFDELGRLAELGANLWSALALACDRHAAHTVYVHFSEITTLTLAASTLVDELRESST
jgi:hypothetical protein